MAVNKEQFSLLRSFRSSQFGKDEEVKWVPNFSPRQSQVEKFEGEIARNLESQDKMISEFKTLGLSEESLQEKESATKKMFQSINKESLEKNFPRRQEVQTRNAISGLEKISTIEDNPIIDASEAQFLAKIESQVNNDIHFDQFTTEDQEAFEKNKNEAEVQKTQAISELNNKINNYRLEQDFTDQANLNDEEKQQLQSFTRETLSDPHSEDSQFSVYDVIYWLKQKAKLYDIFSDKLNIAANDQSESDQSKTDHSESDQKEATDPPPPPEPPSSTELEPSSEFRSYDTFISEFDPIVRQLHIDSFSIGSQDSDKFQNWQDRLKNLKKLRIYHDNSLLQMLDKLQAELDKSTDPYVLSQKPDLRQRAGEIRSHYSSLLAFEKDFLENVRPQQSNLDNFPQASSNHEEKNAPEGQREAVDEFLDLLASNDFTINDRNKDEFISSLDKIIFFSDESSTSTISLNQILDDPDAFKNVNGGKNNDKEGKKSSLKSKDLSNMLGELVRSDISLKQKKARVDQLLKLLTSVISSSQSQESIEYLNSLRGKEQSITSPDTRALLVNLYNQFLEPLQEKLTSTINTGQDSLKQKINAQAIQDGVRLSFKSPEGLTYNGDLFDIWEKYKKLYDIDNDDRLFVSDEDIAEVKNFINVFGQNLHRINTPSAIDFAQQQLLELKNIVEATDRERQHLKGKKETIKDLRAKPLAELFELRFGDNLDMRKHTPEGGMDIKVKEMLRKAEMISQRAAPNFVEWEIQKHPEYDNHEEKEKILTFYAEQTKKYLEYLIYMYWEKLLFITNFVDGYMTHSQKGIKHLVEGEEGFRKHASLIRSFYDNFFTSGYSYTQHKAKIERGIVSPRPGIDEERYILKTGNDAEMGPLAMVRCIMLNEMSKPDESLRDMALEKWQWKLTKAQENHDDEQIKLCKNMLRHFRERQDVFSQYSVSKTFPVASEASAEMPEGLQAALLNYAMEYDNEEYTDWLGKKHSGFNVKSLIDVIKKDDELFSVFKYTTPQILAMEDAGKLPQDVHEGLIGAAARGKGGNEEIACNLGNKMVYYLQKELPMRSNTGLASLSLKKTYKYTVNWYADPDNPNSPSTLQEKEVEFPFALKAEKTRDAIWAAMRRFDPIYENINMRHVVPIVDSEKIISFLHDERDLSLEVYEGYIKGVRDIYDKSTKVKDALIGTLPAMLSDNGSSASLAGAYTGGWFANERYEAQCKSLAALNTGAILFRTSLDKPEGVSISRFAGITEAGRASAIRANNDDRKEVFDNILAVLNSDRKGPPNMYKYTREELFSSSRDRNMVPSKVYQLLEPIVDYSYELRAARQVEAIYELQPARYGSIIKPFSDGKVAHVRLIDPVLKQYEATYNYFNKETGPQELMRKIVLDAPDTPGIVGENLFSDEDGFISDKK